MWSSLDGGFLTVLSAWSHPDFLEFDRVVLTEHLDVTLKGGLFDGTNRHEQDADARCRGEVDGVHDLLFEREEVSHSSVIVLENIPQVSLEAENGRCARGMMKKE